MHKFGFSAVIVLCALSSSCWFRKSPSVFVPPPPQAQPRVPTELARLPGPPAIEGDPNVTIPPYAADSIPTLAPPPAPPAPHRSAPAPTRPASPPATAEQPPVPKLGPVFTPEQRREYTRELDERMEHVRRALEILSSKNLTADQAQLRNTIVTFQKQAEQYRDQDLVSAVNLARRADLLAQDLLDRMPQ